MLYLPFSYSSRSLNAATDYSVQLDTGSSDLFIKGATHPIPNTKGTVRIHSSFMTS